MDDDLTEGADLIHTGVMAVVGAVTKTASSALTANDVVEGLLETLAAFVAVSPYVGTLRGKREFLDSIAERLKSRVDRNLAIKRLDSGVSSPLPGLPGGPGYGGMA